MKTSLKEALLYFVWDKNTTVEYRADKIHLLSLMDVIEIHWTILWDKESKKEIFFNTSGMGDWQFRIQPLDLTFMGVLLRGLRRMAMILTVIVLLAGLLVLFFLKPTIFVALMILPLILLIGSY